MDIEKQQLKIPKIFPVMLAGGSGTRLWPLSRKSYPKQFSKLIGKKTLFQETALRLISSNKIKFEPHITLTNTNYRFIVQEQLRLLGLDTGNILIEPEAKNTASSILAASFYALLKNSDPILLIVPSDHLIPETEHFHNAISVGLKQIEKHKIVTFGISPTHAETGYGYLEIEKSNENNDTLQVKKFIEKPSFATAQQMVRSGNFLWNAGIFLFKAKDIVEAFQIVAPHFLLHTAKSVKKATKDLDFLKLDSESWKQLDNISIDYAIMEKIKNLVAVPYSSYWSDLGGWDTVWSEGSKGPSGNVTSEGAHAIDCTNVLLRSEDPYQQIVGLGLNNIMAIAMPDAVLVAHKDKAQDVKKVVESLKANNIPQAENFTKDHRPWGWFESLAMGERFQVKRICIKVGGSLSLQSHLKRSEHWIVVEGTAKVTIEDKVTFVSENQSVYVPLGAIHRIENPNDSVVVLIEVQVGSYLGEDDIIRYEDIYARD